MSIIFTGTLNHWFSRSISYFTIGESHQALVLNYGYHDEYWIDARGDGIKERPPERPLHGGRYLLLPWDIEPGVRQLIGRPYNFRGPIARALHFRWYDPAGLYCDQTILAGSRLSGEQVCHEGDEDKVDPITSERLFVANIFGRGLTPIQWGFDEKRPARSY